MARTFAAASDQYLLFNGTPPVVAAPFTMACWANLDVVNIDQTFMWVGDKDETDNWWGLGLAGTAGSDAWFIAVDGGNAAAQTGVTVVVEEWHHYCAVERSSTDRSIFYDGGSEATESTDLSPDGSDSIAIGMARDSSASKPTDGSIAYAAIWNVALTDAEIAILAAGYSPLFVRPQSLVAFWPLTDDSDIDIVGGYDLTDFNAPTLSPGPPLFNPAPAQIIIPPSGAPPVGNAPTGVFYGPLVGALGGPL